MFNGRLLLSAVVAGSCLVGVSAASATAATTSCKNVTVSGVGTATKIRATGVPCTTARPLAKAYVRTFRAPAGYTCSHKQAGMANGALLYSVRCVRRTSPGRLTFQMSTSMLPPAGA